MEKDSLLGVLFLFKCLFTAQFLLVQGCFLFDKLPLVVQLELGQALVAFNGLFVVLVGGVFGNLGLAILLSIEISSARNGSHSYVLVDEVIGGEVDESIIRLHGLFILLLLHVLELFDSDRLHCLEDLDEVILISKLVVAEHV